MLPEGYYYSEAMVKSVDGGFVHARFTYINGRRRDVYDYNEKTGVYENKDGGYKTLCFTDALVKRYPLRSYYYRAVVETATIMEDRNFVTEEEANAFVTTEVEKLLSTGEYNFTVKVEKQ